MVPFVVLPLVTRTSHGELALLQEQLGVLWKFRRPRTLVKRQNYKFIVLLLLYNGETWTLKEENIRSLHVFEMSVARKILGCSRRDYRRNTDILNKLSIEEDIVKILRTRRLSYFGHVARMHLNRYPHTLLHGHISGVRSRGRPRKKIDGQLNKRLRCIAPIRIRLAEQDITEKPDS